MVARAYRCPYRPEREEYVCILSARISEQVTLFFSREDVIQPLRTVPKETQNKLLNEELKETLQTVVRQQTGRSGSTSSPNSLMHFSETYGTFKPHTTHRRRVSTAWLSFSNVAGGRMEELIRVNSRHRREVSQTCRSSHHKRDRFACEHESERCPAEQSQSLVKQIGATFLDLRPEVRQIVRTCTH
jgi:hypothetical protein